MRVQAGKKKAHILAGSIVERENELFYNTSFLINPEGDIIGKYRKMHLFPYQSEERQLLTPTSMIVDPWGTVLAKAEDYECIVMAQINSRQVGEVRNEFPALADRALI